LAKKKSSSPLSEQQAKLTSNKAELKELWALDVKMNEEQFKRIELLEKENQVLEKNSKIIEKSSKNIKDQNKFLDDTEDILGSIADKVGKTSKLYKDSEKYLKAQKTQLTSIANYTEQIGDAKLSKEADKAVQAYKKYQQSVAAVADRTSFTGKRQEEANVAIARARAEYEQSVAGLSKMGEEGEFVLNTLNNMANQTDKFGTAVTATTEEWKSMDAVLSQFSGIPAMQEINTLLKTNIRDTVAWKAAVFAVGAALGKAAYDYFGAPQKAAIQQDKEIKQRSIDNIAEVAKIRKNAESIPAQIEQERLEKRISAEGEIQRMQREAAFSGQKAAIQFSAQMQQGAAQFERAAKTALFGNGIGSVGYGAAQLQLAGVSADKIASAMEAASEATGKMPTGKIGADMSIMAERTGTSVENIASINEMFERLDGASESTAMNLSEGMRAMADSAHIGLGKLMREVADASKDALSYNIKSGPALAKQVAYAQSLGVSFQDIAKAGKSMVMNYADSIKKEMQLSAMLGKDVDLSEVRAKFASGDTTGAMESLKAQGLDPKDMDMFQQQALQDALGGMDLNSLSKVATKSGANVGGLKEGNAQKGNQAFLSKTQAAEATLNSKQAAISANTAILDAKLSQKIADSYLASGEYNDLKLKQAAAAISAENLAKNMDIAWKSTQEYNDQLANTAKLDIEKGIEGTLKEGAAALVGGMATSLLDSAGGKIIGKVKGMFGKGGGGPAETPAPSESAGPTSIADVAKDTAISGAAAGADALIPGAGGVVESLSSQVEAVEEPLEKAMTLGEKLKDFGKGVGSFLKSVGTGVGSAIKAVLQGIGQGLISVSTGLIALTPAIPVMLAFGAAVLLTTPALMALAPIVIRIAEVIGDVLVKALEMAGPIITSIFNGIANVIKSVGTAISGIITSVATSIQMFATLDATNLAAVAGSITLLAGAVGLFGGASILGAIGSFFGGGVFDDLKDISSYASPIMATALSVDALANAFDKLSSIDVSSLTKIPWGDMEDFASEGGKFILANNGGGSFALSKETTKNIEKMATNTEAMVKLNNTLVKLTQEGFFGGETSQMKLYIDGKDVSTSMKRYHDNTNGGGPKK